MSGLVTSLLLLFVVENSIYLLNRSMASVPCIWVLYSLYSLCRAMLDATWGSSSTSRVRFLMPSTSGVQEEDDFEEGPRRESRRARNLVSCPALARRLTRATSQ